MAENSRKWFVDSMTPLRGNGYAGVFLRWLALGCMEEAHQVED
jgi:hypothetical protein